MSADGDEQQHPPVPPMDSVRLAKHEKTVGTRVLEREKATTDCPRCRGIVEYIERTTGRVIVDMWDAEQWDSDEYDLSVERDEIERFQRCRDCGWRVDL